jgi:spore germination protein YaaH
MDDGIAAHVDATSLTTLALFSVTNTSDGAIDTTQPGYERITGPVGTRLIADAHARNIRVELVFTSFGRERNARLFEDRDLEDATIGSLVGIARELGVDGINVDVESLDPVLVPAYGEFVGRLRAALRAADQEGEVSIATGAHALGAAMALAGSDAGADRVFLMGYDYRTPGSEPGASAPLGRRDGDRRTLAWSLDIYEALGVPVDRTILGLPLYGVEWPVAAPVVGAPQVGRGDTWIPRQHLDVLADGALVPVRDDIEMVEVYLVAPDGTVGAPATPGPGFTPSPPARGWRAVYVDSPATLAAKLALANDRGLAGAGFWAIGYERGLPGYTSLMNRFAAGESMR